MIRTALLCFMLATTLGGCGHNLCNPPRATFECY